MVWLPPLDDVSIVARAVEFLERVVAIDSSSDESSASIPSTVGQVELSQVVAGLWREYGAHVHNDEFGNVIGKFAGRGLLAQQSPIALIVHLDTARGTQPLASLLRSPQWSGASIAYAKNPRLEVNVSNYPGIAQFIGEELIFGDGLAPFGLDDKLGLVHLLSLARLLATYPDVAHRPVYLIGRPDEEIGRDAAVMALAGYLAQEGIDTAYTVDGIEPLEVNVENFDAAAVSLTFPAHEMRVDAAHVLEIEILGVNTHGATAKAEGHRDALRLAAEMLSKLQGQAIEVHDFHCDALRDCDGMLRLGLASSDLRDTVAQVVEQVMTPHLPRGAGFNLRDVSMDADTPSVAKHGVLSCLQTVAEFLDYNIQPLFCEDSEGYQGYSHPYRVRHTDTHVVLDVRVRDFSAQGLAGRIEWLRLLSARIGAGFETSMQYRNMGDALRPRPDLAQAAIEAAAQTGQEARLAPIRGGTGIGPFIDAGVAVANLGTGYFAPESEKEFTTVEGLNRHARWLFALVQLPDARR